MDDEARNENNAIDRYLPTYRTRAPTATVACDLEPSAVCMTVVADGNRIAFAAYNEAMNQMLMEECIWSSWEDLMNVERILQAIRPTLLLLSPKVLAQDELLETLTSPLPCDEEIAVTDQPRASGRNIPYSVLKRASLDPRACTALITRLRVRSLAAATLPSPAAAAETMAVLPETYGHGPAYFGAQEHRVDSFQVSNFHALASVVNFDSVIQIQAIGSLLSFLKESVFRLEEGGYFTINDLVRSRSSMFMHVSCQTLSALQIFSTQHHPLVAAKGAGNAKEGNSLFALLDRTKSRLGRERLRDWMLKPLIDVQAIALRQDGVELFLQPALVDAVGAIQLHLKQIGPVDKILGRLRKGNASPNDFLVLSRTLAAALAIIEIMHIQILRTLQTVADPPPIPYPNPDPTEPTAAPQPVQQQVARFVAYLEHVLLQCHPATIHDLLEKIEEIVDEDATIDSQQSVVVRRGYSEELDSLKQDYANLDAIMHDATLAVKQKLPHLQNAIKVVYIPQIGFLVRIADWSGEVHLPEDFSFRFSHDQHFFFKNDEAANLDHTVGDLDSWIKDTEALIVAGLEKVILENDFYLEETLSVLAEVDCIVSFASGAVDCKYVRPLVVPCEENCIMIKNGRHPLQEVSVDAFIPNDTFIDDNQRINIVTGPNHSGKSCYARQVGVLTYMAQLGCFIPCESARISVVEQILTRFSTVETCAVPQSSFQLDLSQMGSILRRATPNSLVIIDEFGKGTSPSSGIALLTAALGKLSEAHCKLVCTTHFLEIFSMELVKDGVDGVKALQMTVQIPTNTNKIPLPLFKLKDGVANSSAGLVCARMAGVKHSVIARANEILIARKEGRRLEPLVDVLASSYGLARSTLELFLETDFEAADQSEIDKFLSNLPLASGYS